MPYAKILLFLAAGTLAACESGGGASVRVGGSAAVGVSTGSSSGISHSPSVGPPPGRTEAERAARRAYYRGPRGDEF